MQKRWFLASLFVRVRISSYLCNALGDALRVKAAAQHSSRELYLFSFSNHKKETKRQETKRRFAKI